MRWIYLSPHFDDAVLSCGGLIFDQARAGIPVEIWTVLAGNPPPGPLSDFAQKNHALWGVATGAETVAMRKEEDREAATAVGAELVHFDFPDCIYRRSPKGEYLYTETVMIPPVPGDRGLPRRIAEALKSELRRDDELVCPLTLGGHADHTVVRRAAELLRRPLRYYADVPYIMNYPASLEPAVVAMRAEHYPISAAGLDAWVEGVAAYSSQVGSLLKDHSDLFAAIRAYWWEEKGIRLWQPV
ncbi:MAG TPA: PIG-L family deacetylase [Anaerolineales bacterium]|nr:PIG-L family deacetylase [Anaerolineales bacterium]